MQHLLALAAVVPAVLGQTFYGCYTEVPTRALSDFSQVDYDNMTVAICETFCTGQGSTLWGLEYGGEWYVPPPCSPSNQIPATHPATP